LFPNGVSPFGLHEASGNVWEWTTDWYKVYEGGDEKASADFGVKFKVVRGGSWNYDSRFARCAYRYRLVPVSFDNTLGFRVLSPVSISGF
jgi:iron(II)-dependent oxidoreductase